MTDEEYKERHRQYSKAYYERQKKKKIELGIISDKPHEKRKILSVISPKYITVQRFKNGIIMIEAITRKFKTTPYDRYVEWQSPNSLYHRKIRLEKMVKSINTDNCMVVLDDYSVQVYLKSDKKLQETVDAVKDFVEESVKIMLENLES